MNSFHAPEAPSLLDSGQLQDGFGALFQAHPLPMWVYEEDSLRFVDVNEATLKHYGYSREEFLKMTLADIRPSEDVEKLKKELANRPRTGLGRLHSRGWRHRKKDGTQIWVDVYSQDVNYQGRTLRMSVVHDATELKQVADRLQQQSEYYQQLFQNSPEAIVFLDLNDVVIDANVTFTTMFQYSLAEMKGRKINDLIVPQDKLQEAGNLSRSALSNHLAQHDTVRRRKDGKLIEVTALGYPITLKGEQIGVFAIYRDISESKRIASELAYHSTHDALTRLINRHEFERRARELLRKSTRSGSRHALLYLDLDQFKVVNEACGHTAGDCLLIELSELLRSQIRDADSLARLGGDEFGVLLADASLQEAQDLATRIVESARTRRFKWGGRAFSMSVSVGVVEIGPATDSLTALLSAADTACFTAKERGRARVQVYRPDDLDLQRMRGEMSWASRIMEALEQDRFTLYYQKIVPVAPKRLNGAKYEVLVRMKEADNTRIAPGQFVPAAERYGLMPGIDRRVVTLVFERMKKLFDERPDMTDQVSVNLSGTSISEEGFAAFIRDQFSRTGLPPRLVCFELTETAAIANLARALTFIAEMRDLGCSIALDDFGAGMSSFNYLKTLNVDYLKIDGAFIKDILTNPLDCAMAEAINKVGQVKGIRTIAEFVESDGILNKLKELGVDYAQGFHIHRPEPWLN